jgi:alkylation response protein AidB-like acyl-CoA dehydrogenase
MPGAALAEVPTGAAPLSRVPARAPGRAAPEGVASGRAAVLDNLRRIARAELAPIAGRVDHEGFYPEAALRALGEAGAFSLHLRAPSPLGWPDLPAAIEAMAAISSQCMSSGFCAWCQNASGWYLENTANAGLRERLQPGIATAALLGGTGLSNPVKALAGLEALKLKGRRVAGGWRVSGTLPWVSNLGEGHWFGTIFRDAEEAGHRVMAMVRCGAPGVEIRQSIRFIALEGTGTYSILFRDAFIPNDDLLADPLGDMARRIKPGFVLLQAGMGLGVIEACLASMRRDNVHYARINSHLPLQADALEDQLGALRERVLGLAGAPLEPGPGYLRRVLETRVACSELTLAASQAAMMHAGARGYLEGSVVSRLQREAWFVAIITPSIRHLRHELAALAAN